MTSPESPAIQAADRLREVALAAAGTVQGPFRAGDGYTSVRFASTDEIVDTVLAAVLPVHRTQVLQRAADFLDPGPRDSVPEGEMTSAGWVRATQRGAASNLRMWASPAFVHMWTPTDVPIGVMDTPELAARAVTAMNQDDDRAAIASAIDAAAEDAEQRAQGNPVALMYVRGMRHAAQLARSRE